jgi:hypothetical protein
MKQQNVLALVLILLVLLGGGWARLVDLSAPDLHDDELNHLYAARSLATGAGPALPSGEMYTRGMDITRMVGVMDRRIENTELASRLPSALFGVVNLILFAAIAWAIAGPWAAFWAALLLAIYPEAVLQSRHTRFYTYQLCFGILALFTGWRALSGAGRREAPDRTDFRTQWLWLGATFLLLLLATRVQFTTLSIVAAVSVAVAVAAVAELVARGWGAWRRSAAIQAAALGLLAGAAVLILAPSLFTFLLERATWVPAWAGSEAGDPRAYYWDLSAAFPLLISFLPLLLVVVAFRNPRLALWLGIWFTVPFLIHSLFLPWKEERYLLLAVPGLLLLGAIAAAAGSGALFRAVGRALDGRGTPAPASRLVAGGTVGVVVLAAVVTSPAFTQTRKVPPFPYTHEWRTAWTILEGHPGLTSLPIGSSKPFSSHHYWDRVDFGVTLARLENPASTGVTELQEDGVLHAEGALDYYIGIPTLTSAARIRSEFAESGGVVIGIDRERFTWGQIDPTLEEALRNDAVELCRDRCGNLDLFHWSFDEPRAVADDSDNGGGRVLRSRSPEGLSRSSAPPASPTGRTDARLASPRP